MPKSSDSMAAEAARKKPRDHQGILNSTLRVTVTEPNGKTLNIAVFKDRSFMLREESQEPEGLPTSKLHSNRANWLKFRTPRPNSEPAPSQRDCNAETSSARRRLETIALTAEETARPQEQDRSATANAAALAIAQSSTPPAARQLPPLATGRPHPINRDPNATAQVHAALEACQAAHPQIPGQTAPVENVSSPIGYAAYALYLTETPELARFLSAPPSSTPPEIPDKPPINPFEEQYLETGSIPKIPKDDTLRERWWEFAHRYPLAAGTMFAERPSTDKNGRKLPEPVRIPARPSRG